VFHVVVQTLIRSLRKTTRKLPQEKTEKQPRPNDLTGFIVVLFFVLVFVAVALFSNM
jgi:hypothetical protein